MKKLFKNKLFFFILLTLIIFGTGVALAYSYLADEVGFTPKDSNWHVDNVDAALDSFTDRCGYDFTCSYYKNQVIYSGDYTGLEDSVTIQCDGTYKLEVWGAQGATVLDGDDVYSGGYGGYSVGTVMFQSGDVVYINVGGQGESSGSSNCVAGKTYYGGYNGGGNGHCVASNKRIGGGGGATHIATVSGVLNNLSGYVESAVINSKYKSSGEILIVAGGGGASVYQNYDGIYYSYGGHGGGKIGNTASTDLTNWTYPHGTGGSQTAAGTGNANGAFGKGGNNSDTSGAGGGFYGGGCGQYAAGPGGGSGYIASQRLISLYNITKHMYCYNCTTDTDNQTKTDSDGISSCHDFNPTPDCSKAGNGYAKITYLGK